MLSSAGELIVNIFFSGSGIFSLFRKNNFDDFALPARLILLTFKKSSKDFLNESEASGIDPETVNVSFPAGTVPLT